MKVAVIIGGDSYRHANVHASAPTVDQQGPASPAIISAMPSNADPPSTYSDDFILLDQYTADDVEAHLAGEDEETSRQFGWWPNRSAHQTVEHSFADWADHWRNHGPVHTFAVRDKATGTLLGGCQLRKQADGSAEVSHWTGAPYRGRGLAQRVLLLLCLHARSQAIAHLEAHISVNNPASEAVATAAGFAPRDRFQDHGNTMTRFALDQPLPTTNP